MFFLVVAAVVFYAVFIIALSRSAGKLDDALGATIFSSLSAVMPLFVYLASRASRPKEILPTTKNGLIFIVVAGISVALFNLLILRIFQKGSLGYVMPIVYGGAILLSSVAGWLWFSAAINTLQVVGILLVVAGIILVGVSKTA